MQIYSTLAILLNHICLFYFNVQLLLSIVRIQILVTLFYSKMNYFFNSPVFPSSGFMFKRDLCYTFKCLIRFSKILELLGGSVPIFSRCFLLTACLLFHVLFWVHVLFLIISDLKFYYISKFLI